MTNERMINSIEALNIIRDTYRNGNPIPGLDRCEKILLCAGGGCIKIIPRKDAAAPVIKLTDKATRTTVNLITGAAASLRGIIFNS